MASPVMGVTNTIHNCDLSNLIAVVANHTRLHSLDRHESMTLKLFAGNHDTYWRSCLPWR